MPEPAFARVRPAAPPDLADVLAMLGRAGLPTAGVPPSLSNFLVADSGDRLVGAIGLELYGGLALLRSAVVAAEARGVGLGAELVQAILQLARGRGVREVYLLTTTAEDWFPRFGFALVDREAVPAAVRASEEFRGGCPDTAVVMRVGLA
jgi:amino-acid N-acetyltransferase